MFNSTHTLVGLAAARTGLDRWAPHAAWTAVIAANLPDIDIIAAFGGTATYLDHHRGITHSLAGLPILSLLLAFVMFRISGGSFSKHFAISLIAMATHPLLDLANTYGLRPFLPFIGTWYYGDTLFIVDPFLDLILLAGIVISYWSVKRKNIAAGLTLGLALTYIGWRFELRDVARAQLARYSSSTPEVVRLAVSPQMLHPLVWAGLVETNKDISGVIIDVAQGTTTESYRLTKVPESIAVKAAEATRAGAVFKSFARFPIARVEQTAAGYRVLLVDLRFFQKGLGTALAAEVLLDRSLHVESESISFTLPVRGTGE